jgi:MFS transporter, FSR family, fosmidomycin resistance protein
VPISPVLFLVAAGHLVNDIYMGFLAPLYPLIMGQFHLTLSQVGVISMVAAVASAVSQPFFGLIFDRYGASAALYLAPLVTGVFVSLIGIAPSYPLFLCALFLGCLGSAAFHPTGASVTPSLSGKHPEMGMAIFSAGGNLGFAAGPAAFAFFVAAFGLGASPLLVVPAFGVAAALFFTLPVRSLREKTRSAKRATWRSLFQDPRRRVVLLRLVFVNFAITVGVRGMQTYLPVYLASGGTSVTAVGVLFTIMLGLGAAASIVVSSLSRRTGRKPLILLSVAVGAPLFLVGVLLMPSMAGSIVVAAAGVVLTFTNPLLIISAQSQAQDSPALASSLIMGVSWGLAGLLMVPLGWIGDLLGLKVVLLAASAFPLAGVFSILRLPSERKPSPAAASR